MYVPEKILFYEVRVVIKHPLNGQLTFFELIQATLDRGNQFFYAHKN